MDDNKEELIIKPDGDVDLSGLPPELAPDTPLEETLIGLPVTAPEDLTVFSTNDNSDAVIQDAQRQAEAAGEETSTADVLGAAWTNVSITKNVMDAFSGSTFDPTFSPSEDHWKELADAGFSDDQQNDFFSVLSDQDWQTKKARYEEAIEADQILARAGWGGVSAQILMSVLDPPALIAGVLSGGIVNAALGAKRAASLGKVSTALLQGGVAATENAALEAILVQTKPTGEASDILYAALGGAAFGTLFGAAGRVFTKTEDDGISRALNKAKDAVYDKADGETIGSSGSSGGAAHVTSPNEAISDAAEEHIRQVRNEGDVAPTEFSAVRFDATGQLISSEHPLARDMSKLAEDGVGKTDGSVNVFSAAERQTKLHGTMMLKLNRAFTDNYASWAEEMGLNKFQAFFDKDRKRFGEEVTAATREAFPDNLSPSVKAAAQAQRKFYAEYAYLANNPLANEGSDMAKAVRGFENLIVNPDYVPRIHDPRKMTALIQQFGHTNMGKAVGQAMRAINSDISEEVADKLGKAYIKSIQRHQVSSASASRQLSGEDLDGLREMLEESRNYDNLDLDDGDIDMIINSLTKKAKSDTKHGRSRLLFDEKFSVHIRPISGTEPVLFRMSDMFDNNAETLAENYSRTMSGEIALRQVGIDGIRDINKTIQHIRETTHQYKKKDKSEADIKNIEYLATHILGRPVGDYGDYLFSARNSTFGKAQRLISDFNVIRVLGRVGEAQLVEIGNLLSTKNFKAFIQSMPTFRDFMTNASRMKRSDPLFEELEIATGIGADGIQGSYLNNIDEFGGGLAERSGIAAGLELGKRAVFAGSGMRYINNFLQKMSMRTIVQRFANAAHKGDLDKAFSLKDLSAMGLSKDDAQAILGQIKKHSKNRKGAITGNRLYELKWDKWDIDTKAKFENAIYRESRRLVQQNDVGTTNRIQGTPLGKMFFQFRSFLLSAWTKQTLHALHKRDMDAFSKMAIQTFVGSLVFVGQTIAGSADKEDSQEYINKRLKGADGDEPWRVISAGFAKSGFSGFIPMAVDGALSFTHEDGIFNARSSGLSSTGLLSNPSLDLLDKTISATSGAVSAALTDDYDYSKVDARALKALIPFQNMRGVDMALNMVFEDLPERSQEYQFNNY